MKFGSYEFDGKAGWGAILEDGIVPLTRPGAGDLREAIRNDALPRQASELAGLPRIATTDIRWMPVIPNAAKIFCVGLNYDEHRRESRRDEVGKPTVFVRFADSQVGHGQPLVKPAESEQFDFEGEIAIVLRGTGRRIRREDAWEHIAGYAPYNDASVRDWQKHTTQWTPGKNFCGTGGFGPWMTSRGEIADGQVLELETRLNGEVVQQATTDMMLFDIPTLVSYISTFCELHAGDVIVTGTPGGVGAARKPPLWMKDGDRVDVTISAIGTLSNTVVNDCT